MSLFSLSMPHQDAGRSAVIDSVLARSAFPVSASTTRGLLGRYRILAEILAVFVIGFTLTRFGLVFAFADWRHLSVWDWLRLGLTGLRFDLLVALCLIQPQLWYFTCCRERWLLTWPSRWFIEFGWLLAFLLAPLLAVIEWLFFEEFTGRLNYIAFEYLVYPNEVCCNIWQSYSIVPLLGIVLGVSVGLWFALRRRFQRLLDAQTPWRQRMSVFASMWAVIAGLWLTSGMASMNVTNDRTANECGGNGVYTFIYHAWTCHFDYEHFYLTIHRDVAAAEVRKQLLTPSDVWHQSSQNPLDRTLHGSESQRDWNVVVILEESLGSDFVGVLGDKRGLTPNIDKLASQGILFDNFFATGNRTARALEAVLASLPPIPTESILKRDRSQHIYTLAHVLTDRGYNRLFITAGRGLFDGVRAFMTANGFNRFIEQKDFQNPTFSNAWGVSDEDLFHRALSEFDSLHAAGKPFLSVLLTVSNHRPFTYPDGRIDRPSSERLRDNAVKYADWALGHFFAEAATHDWHKNTLFVVLGDHGARIYGSQLFPMNSYRIPVLLIRPDGIGHGTRCSTLASSLDIAPTIMGQLGGSYRSVFFGRDAWHLPPEQGYALMQHNHDVALLTASRDLVVLDARKQAWVYRFDPQSFKLTLEPVPPKDRVQATIAFFQMASRLYYEEKLFPSEVPSTSSPRVATATK